MAGVVFLQQGGGLEGGNRLVAAGGAPDVAGADEAILPQRRRRGVVGRFGVGLGGHGGGIWENRSGARLRLAAVGAIRMWGGG